MSDVMLLGRVGELVKYIKETGRDDIYTRQDLASIQIAQDELTQRADRIAELETKNGQQAERIVELEAELSTHQWAAVNEGLPDREAVVEVYGHPEPGFDKIQYAKVVGSGTSSDLDEWAEPYIFYPLAFQPTHWRYVKPPAIETQ